MCSKVFSCNALLNTLVIVQSKNAKKCAVFSSDLRTTCFYLSNTKLNIFGVLNADCTQNRHLKMSPWAEGNCNRSLCFV